MSRVCKAALQVILPVLWLMAATAPSRASGTVVRVYPDRTCAARFEESPPKVGELCTLVRDNEEVGEMVIRRIDPSEILVAPAEGLLGAPRVGDQLSPAPARQTDSLAGGWRTWSDPDASFTVRAPAYHERALHVDRRGPFRLDQTIDTFFDPRLRLTYKVVWFELPGGFLESSSFCTPSDSVREEMTKAEFRIGNPRAVSHEGMQGVEYDVSFSDHHGQTRTFVTERRLYQLYVISPFREVPKRPAKKFFDSFRLHRSAGEPLKAPPAQALRHQRSLVSQAGARTTK